MIEAIFVGTFVPLLFLLALARHSRPLLLCFTWGVVSFVIAAQANTWIIHSLGPGVSRLHGGVLVAPLVEEGLKMLPLLYLLLRAAPTFTPFYYIFGMAVGVGFAIDENLLYLLRHRDPEVSGIAFMGIRSVSTCLMHGVTVALIGLAFTSIRRRGASRTWLAPLAYLGAVGIHSLFNFLVLTDRQALAILLPMAVFLAGAIPLKLSEGEAPETRGTKWET